jgi:nuclear mRNA export protein SAC3
MELRAVAQRNNVAKSRRAANTEATQNYFTKFFSMVGRPSTPFLLGCLLEVHFDDVRKGALKAMRKSFMEKHKAFPVLMLTDMLGFNDAMETVEFVQACKLEIAMENGTTVGVKFHRNAPFDGECSFIIILCRLITHPLFYYRTCKNTSY